MIHALLIWLMIGSLIWVFIDGLGVIENTFVARARSGRPMTKNAMVLATLMMIVGWPVFIWSWVLGMWRRA